MTDPGSDIETFFGAPDKLVLTFVGYSGSGYEDAAGMLARARQVLDAHDPARTIVNIGATVDGIGAVYELAKDRGFPTAGIVSTQAQALGATLSPFVDDVFFVEDDSWGGFLEGTHRLSPTSAAMVEYSDVLIGIGGGEVARDEMIAAKRAGKPVRFFPADLDHRRATDAAERKGMPPPLDFAGPAAKALSVDSP